MNRSETLRRVGHMRQLGGIRLAELADGPECGVRVADVDTGAIRFTVALDRGMDIAGCWVFGMPLAWLSPVGVAHPHRYEHDGTGWMRTFPGGLVSTCGLSYLGAPCIDMGQDLGVHGRISHSQASKVSVNESWVDDEYLMSISGEMGEYSLFGENLVMKRSITTRLGSTTIVIDDAVTNAGYQTTPLMLLYHINLGWPMLSSGARLHINGSRPVPRDEAAAQGQEEWNVFDDPTKDYAEKVFYHTPHTDETGYAQATLVNTTLNHPGFPKGGSVTIRYKGLPRLVQWKQMGEGAYVLGLEPSNCGVEGRAKERERGTLDYLSPDETRHYRVEICVDAL